MSEQDPTIVMSDSLVDKIDVGQFYKHGEIDGDIMVSIWVAGTVISQPIREIKISGSRVHAKFSCNAEQTTSLILSSSDISSISFLGSQNASLVLEGDNFCVISKSFTFSGADAYECEIVVKILNT